MKFQKVHISLLLITLAILSCEPVATYCVECHPLTVAHTDIDHDTFYPLIGAHATIANDCTACHNGNFNNTPNTCYGCHTSDYNQTTNPNHIVGGFSTDCTACHTQDGWVPSTFDHDSQFFPIYSGSHKGEWNDCIGCHSNPSNYGEFTCLTCHINPQTDENHNGVNGYVYESNACLVCHPNG